MVVCIGAFCRRQWDVAGQAAWADEMMPEHSIHPVGHRMLTSFSIDDDLGDQLTRAMEVTLVLSNGDRRWCFFVRPQALAACGDWINNTNIRFHYDAPHMIVVAGELSPQVIEQALKHLEAEGALERCSLSIA